MKYAWIDTQRLECPLPDRFELTAVNVTGYGAWRRCGKPDCTRVTDRQAVASIESLHAEVKLAYGSRRIHRELQGRGNRIALRGIERLMRENGIRARQKRRYKAKTDSRHSMPVAPNLFARKFTPVAPNRVWTGVIKRIHTREGWMHFASVLDQFNREVVGWSIKSRMTVEIVTDALAMTWFKPMPSAGVNFHKDRGECASQVMTSGLIEYGMTASMSRKGNCGSNATTECFFRSLKNERVHGKTYAPRVDARADLFEYIDVFSYRSCRHSTPGGSSPTQFLDEWIVGHAARQSRVR